jgi:mRNA interferase MazF
VLTRSSALRVLTTVTVAPITRTIRGIGSEVELGPGEGLPEPCVINCDTLASIPQSSLDPQPVGVLSLSKRAALDRALRYSLDIMV